MSCSTWRRGHGRGQTLYCVRQYVTNLEWTRDSSNVILVKRSAPISHRWLDVYQNNSPLKHINAFQSSVYFKTINQWHNFIIKDKHPRHTKGCFVRWVQGERAGRGRRTPRFSFFRRAWFSGVIVWDPLGAVVADQIVEQSNKQNCIFGIATSLIRLR